MAVSVLCVCGKRLKVRDDYVGKRINCPKCKTLLTVAETLRPLTDSGPLPRQTTSRDAADDDDRPSRRTKKTKQDGGRGLLIVILLLVLAGGGVGVFFLISARGGNEPPPKKDPGPADTETLTLDKVKKARPGMPLKEIEAALGPASGAFTRNDLNIISTDAERNALYDQVKASLGAVAGAKAWKGEKNLAVVGFNVGDQAVRIVFLPFNGSTFEVMPVD
ncbi:MAG: hypothetical protein U0793_08695 [Gemmataceae bacterium]